MKAKDIKYFELGEHCYGKIIRVNGIDYEDLDKEQVIELITDMFENDINASSLIMEAFVNSLEHLQYDEVESDSDICEQCENYNTYAKYKDIK